MIMSCPRQCGIDIRHHHSTDSIDGRCDTGPMPLDEMVAWFQARGVEQPSDLIAEHYGKTEAELEELYQEMHGSTA